MVCPILKPDPQGIERAAQIVLQGGIVAFPTETFYGLAADAWSERALEKVFAMKGREESKPLLLLVAEAGWVPALVERISPLAERLMEQFWPGPLTLVFEASPQLSPLLTAGSGKIGLRVSSHPAALALTRAAGRAITGTSANLSGQPSASLAAEVLRSLGEAVDAVLDGGKTVGGIGSTVLDVSGTSPKIIREGAVPRKDLADFLGGSQTAPAGQ
jgi:L-threonylcarbamoyladenylate synthase